MLKRAFQFVSFYFEANTIYQIEDSFLYQLTYHSLENPILTDNSFLQLLAYKERLHTDKNEFQVTDLGAKTKVTNAKKRSIGNFAKNSSSGKRILAFFYNLSRWFKPKSFLELGAGLGFSSASIGLGHSDCRITTVEGNSHLAPFTKTTFQSLGLEATVFIDDITNLLPILEQSSFDIIFNDGNHTYDYSMQYWNTLKASLEDQSLFIMDDIRWSAGMKKAWNEIKSDPKVNASIDLFTLGILIINPNIKEKQHWKIVPSAFKPWKK